MLQALFFCRPFRERVLGYKPLSKRKESLLTCLADLFGNIASQKKKVGVLAPKKFVARLRKENGKLIYGALQYAAKSLIYYLAYIFDCPFTCQLMTRFIKFMALASRLIILLFVKVNRSVYKCVRKPGHSHVDITGVGVC